MPAGHIFAEISKREICAAVQELAKATRRGGRHELLPVGIIEGNAEDFTLFFMACGAQVVTVQGL